MWYQNENEEMTPEEENSRYLQQNPYFESSLWAEWVEVVCAQYKIANPTNEEWDKLRENFYHGKAPVASVVELKQMRYNK